MQTKTCTKCCNPKELECFAPTNQQLKFGVKSWCRDCEREYKREWVKKDPTRPIRNIAKWKATNREKVRQWGRDYSKWLHENEPERAALYERRARLKRVYGVTMAWFEEKATEQKGVCAICGGPPTSLCLCIDHCHATGKVRELLCTACNTGLHKMEQNIEWIRKAEAYLLRHG